MKTANLDCQNCEMRSKSVFCDLKTSGIKKVSDNKCMGIYKKGEIIYHQGANPAGLYCVHDGKVKLSSISNDGKSTIISISSPGELFAHKNVFNNQVYQTSAIAIEESKVCFIEKKFFFDLLQEEPSVSLQLVSQMAKEMGAAVKSISDLTQKTVRARFATFLVDACKNFGKEIDGKTYLDIKLTREELASIVGGATETVIRLISDFKDEGLITQEGKTIVILDLDALKDEIDS